MRGAVRGHPDHPERLKLEQVERRIREGAETRKFHVWYASPGRLRINQDYSGSSPVPFWDCVVDGDEGWGHAKGQVHLTRVPATQVGEPDYLNEQYLFLAAYRDFKSGSLWKLRGLPLEYGAPQRRGEDWVISGSMANVRVTIVVTWDGANKVGMCKSLSTATIDPANQGRRAAESWRVSGWRNDPALGLLATTIEKLNERGVVDSALRFQSARIAPPDEIGSALRAPSGGRLDPMREGWQVVEVRDYRRGPVRVTQFGDGRSIDIPNSDLPEVVAANSLRLHGWLVASLILAAVVAWRVRVYLSRRRLTS